MISPVLTEAMERASSWPEAAQADLAIFAHEMDSALRGEIYQPTPEELVQIDRGLQDVAGGRVVSLEDVSAMLARYRPA